MEFRRSIPRQPTDWSGFYRIEGDQERRWRQCRVLDISTGGAALELVDATPIETQDRLIVVSVQLRGEVRNSVPGDDNRMRVGIQFADLTAAARIYVESLSEQGARW